MLTAENWVEQLKLVRHPTAGYFCETYRSSLNINTPDREGNIRSAHTIIYYLLQSEEIGCWRRIKSDETFHFYAGDELLIHMIDIQHQLKQVRLGNLQPQFTVIANTWFALEVSKKCSYSLVACAVTPGFDYRDYELSDKTALLDTYPQYQTIIERFTKP